MKAKTPRLCTVPGCKNPLVAKGFCCRHHWNMRRHGTLNPPRPQWGRKLTADQARQIHEFARRRGPHVAPRIEGETMNDDELIDAALAHAEDLYARGRLNGDAGMLKEAAILARQISRFAEALHAIEGARPAPHGMFSGPQHLRLWQRGL